MSGWQRIYPVVISGRGTSTAGSLAPFYDGACYPAQYLTQEELAWAWGESPLRRKRGDSDYRCGTS